MVDNDDGKKQESSASQDETQRRTSNPQPADEGRGAGDGGGNVERCDELVITSEEDAFNVLAGRCKTPRNRTSSGPHQAIFHDFIPRIGFPIPF